MNKMKKFGTLAFAIALVLGTELFAQAASDFNVELTADGNGCVITKYKGKATNVVIPAKIEGLPVKEIDSGAFYSNYSIVSVTIPSSVERINGARISDDGYYNGDGAFSYCSSLTSVIFPNSVTQIVIGARAFSYCRKLSSVRFPAQGKVYIGGQAFRETALATLSITGNMEFGGGGQFMNCDKLQSVIIGADVKELWGNFLSSSTLRDVVFRSANTVISEYTFWTRESRWEDYTGCPALSLASQKAINAHLWDNNSAGVKALAKADVLQNLEESGFSDAIYYNGKRFSSAVANDAIYELQKEGKIVMSGDYYTTPQVKAALLKDAKIAAVQFLEANGFSSSIGIDKKFDYVKSDAIAELTKEGKIVQTKYNESDYWITPQKKAALLKDAKIAAVQFLEESGFSSSIGIDKKFDYVKSDAIAELTKEGKIVQSGSYYATPKIKAALYAEAQAAALQFLEANGFSLSIGIDKKFDPVKEEVVSALEKEGKVVQINYNESDYYITPQKKAALYEEAQAAVLLFLDAKGFSTSVAIDKKFDPIKEEAFSALQSEGKVVKSGDHYATAQFKAARFADAQNAILQYLEKNGFSTSVSIDKKLDPVKEEAFSALQSEGKVVKSGDYYATSQFKAARLEEAKTAIVQYLDKNGFSLSVTIDKKFDPIKEEAVSALLKEGKIAQTKYNKSDYYATAEHAKFSVSKWKEDAKNEILQFLESNKKTTKSAVLAALPGKYGFVKEEAFLDLEQKGEIKADKKGQYKAK